MVRTIITPANTDVHLTIEKEYVGKAIEITYLALDELAHKTEQKKTMGDFWNTISDDAAGAMRNKVQQMRNEWGRDI